VENKHPFVLVGLILGQLITPHNFGPYFGVEMLDLLKSFACFPTNPW